MQPTKTFRTSPIYFPDLEAAKAFANSLSGIRIDPTNFYICNKVASDGDINLPAGQPLNIEINPDDNSVVVHGNGGLTYFDVNAPFAFQKERKYGNLMLDVFDFEFNYRFPNVEIYTSEQDDQGEKSQFTFNLRQYHSKAAYENRLEQILMVTKEIKGNIAALNKEFDALMAGTRRFYQILDKIEQDEKLDLAM